MIQFKSLAAPLKKPISKGLNYFQHNRFYLTLPSATSSSKFDLNKSYSSTSDRGNLPSITGLSKEPFNLKTHKVLQKLLLANTKFYCLDKPLLGVNKDGSISEWSLLPPLTKDEFDPKHAFVSEESKDVFDELEKAHRMEAAFERFHESLPEDGPLSIQYVSSEDVNESVFNKRSIENHPLITKFDGNSTEVVDKFLDDLLEKINSRPRRSKIIYRATSVLRKRRLKMNKHKYKKLRKRTRALRKRLNK